MDFKDTVQSVNRKIYVRTVMVTAVTWAYLRNFYVCMGIFVFFLILLSIVSCSIIFLSISLIKLMCYVLLVSGGNSHTAN